MGRKTTDYNYLGECFLKIATHLSYKPNFVNYMFRDDMISDGIENCVQYIHNFDPEKSKNPFRLLHADHSLCLSTSNPEREEATGNQN